MNKQKYLYHGSIVPDIKILEPHKRYTPIGVDFEAIYASPLMAYAVAHSFPWGSDEGFDLDVRDEKVYFSVPARFKNRLQVPVYIYKISSDKFEYAEEELVGYTWYARTPIEVLDIISYPTIEEGFKTLGGIIEFK